MLFNLGGGKKNAISLKELSKKCENLTNRKIKIIKQKNTSIYDIPYYVTDNFKVKKIYKWNPKKKISDIIKDIYEWMLPNKKKLKKYII